MNAKQWAVLLEASLKLADSLGVSIVWDDRYRCLVVSDETNDVEVALP